MYQIPNQKKSLLLYSSLLFCNFVFFFVLFGFIQQNTVVAQHFVGFFDISRAILTFSTRPKTDKQVFFDDKSQKKVFDFLNFYHT